MKKNKKQRKPQRVHEDTMLVKTVRLSDSLDDQITQIAHDSGKTRSEVMREFIQSGVYDYKSNHRNNK